MNNADTIDRVNKRAPRRKHSAELRAKVLRACKQPGASVAEIAQLHELNANVVHRWRVDERNVVASGIDKSQSGFLGVNILLEIQATPEPVPPSDIRVEVRGWEKGSVEKNVRDRRTSIWHRAEDRRWTDWAELNAWLAEQIKAAWAELNHPEYLR